MCKVYSSVCWGYTSTPAQLCFFFFISFNQKGIHSNLERNSYETAMIQTVISVIRIVKEDRQLNRWFIKCIAYDPRGQKHTQRLSNWLRSAGRFKYLNTFEVRIFSPLDSIILTSFDREREREREREERERERELTLANGKGLGYASTT